MRSLLVRFILPAALFVAVGFPFATAHAADDNVQITLSPTKQRVTIKAGTTTKGTFSIRNTGKLPFSFKVYAAPYTVLSDATYTPVFTNDTPRTQMSRWVHFDKTSYALQPEATVEIPYTIVTPASIPAGSQFAALFAETDGQNTGSVVTKKRVGMLVYARPTGTTVSKGEATFSPIPHLIIGSSIKSSTKVTNTGNTDFDSTVQLEQKNIFGGTNQTIHEERTVLPDSTRTIDLMTKSVTPAAAYMITQSATINGKVATKATTVYVISPLVAFFAGALVIIIIILGVWRVAHTIRQKNHTKAH